MELRHLRTFLAVAEELRFGAAADRLFLSPSAVTEHIQALERESGVTLFHRGRSVELTAAGAALVEHARKTIAHADAAAAVLSEYAAGRSGRLKVGVLSNGAGALTPQIISTFMNANPQVRVGVHRLNFRDHLDAVVDHLVDVAFVRPAPQDPRVEVVALSEEQRVAVVPARHALADAPELPVEEVLEQPFVGLEERVSGTFSDYLYLSASRGGTAPRTTDVGCEDVTDVLAAVAAGRGVASAVESFRGYENWPGVSYVSLLGADPSVNVLIYRRDDPSPLVATFVAAAVSLARRQVGCRGERGGRALVNCGRGVSSETSR